MDEPLRIPRELQEMADAGRARHVEIIRRQIADGRYDDSEAILAAVAQRLAGELDAG